MDIRFKLKLLLYILTILTVTWFDDQWTSIVGRRVNNPYESENFYEFFNVYMRLLFFFYKFFIFKIFFLGCFMTDISFRVVDVKFNININGNIENGERNVY